MKQRGELTLTLLALLAAILVVSAAGLGGYKHGRKVERGVQAEAHNKAMDALRKQERENAVIDMQAAVEAEAERQKARVEFKDRIVTVEKVIHANPLPAACRLPADAVELLRDVARSATDPAPAAKPKPMPSPAAPSRPGSGATSASLSAYD